MRNTTVFSRVSRVLRRVAPQVSGTETPSKKISQTVALFALAMTISQSSLGSDWYVDGARGSDKATGATSAPLRNVWRAWALAQPGDTIHLLPTTVYGPLYFGEKSGLPGKVITIKGDGPITNQTRVTGKGINFGIYLAREVNYITIQNLNVTAPGAGTYGGWSAIYLDQNHHVTIANNYLHDSGCAGVQATASDYITVDRNRVSQNAKDTTANIFCSGISFHENLDIDTFTGTKMRATNNLIYSNTNKPLALCKFPCLDSDGSGIIIDDSRRTQTDNVAYKGSTLVSNNVIFNNGGRGVHIYKSDNVNVVSNTIYQNNKDPAEGSWRPGEVMVVNGGNINIFNNILYSDGSSGTTDTGAHVAVSVQDCAVGGDVNIDHNVTYNSKNTFALQSFFRNNLNTVAFGANNVWADPRLKTATSDPLRSNFQVVLGSPALDRTPPSNTYTSYDIENIQRAPTVSAGAYQKAAP